MNICRGSVNSRLLIGAAVFIASFVFFQWLQVERVTNNSHHEMPKVDDETVVLTKPGQQSRPASAKRDTKPEPADDNPRPSTNLQAVVTEASRGPDGSELVALPARARTETEQATYDEPQGDLAISGRVLTRSGSPVAGIQVTATATHLFEQGQRKAIPPGRGQRRTTTDYNGAYAFENLANGEYQLRTVATDRYTRALIHVRAGVDFADLIVATHQEIRVQGIVTTEEGDPLFGAKVRPNLAGASEVTTNWEGHYGFDAMLPENVTQMMVRASHEGYRDREIRLAADHSDDANALELNIIMQADAATELADVSGFVTNAARDPVAGQRVLLSSATPRQTYRSITDASGTFVIRGVEPGDDYMV
ncbi:MAG: carboxypeptidase-like regulatory domain-containing protein, partial [Gammaproteobacteria bacterium]|nr:carboxypeptidase-like regulatory domain-containing protein [Gammaproteobacteria bacterium]